MKNNHKIIVPLVSILLGLLLGVFALILTGYDVSALFNSFVNGLTGIDLYSSNPKINVRYIGELLTSSMPIIMTGLSVGFAYRTGLFNIGCEGQVIFGSLVCVSVAILVPMPNVIGQLVCILAGAIAGALWAFIPGILKVRFNVSEVVTGIMLNYTALYSANYFLRNLPGSDVQKTADIPANTFLRGDFLAELTNNSRFHFGFIVVILCAVLFWFIIEKTAFGYSLRATGLNSEGARFAGIKVHKSIVTSMMISGALAGIAGSIIVQGTFGYGRIITYMDNYGFDGIAVALVGGANAIGIVLSGLLFALLNVTQPLLQVNGVPKDIGEIIASSIVFFVAIQYIIKYFLNKFSKKEVI